MKIQSLALVATLAITAAMAAAPAVSRAEIRSNAKDIVVLTPADLPQDARTGEGIFLHPDNAGHVYLYLEQNGGARMTVLDVTDPSRIRAAASRMVEARGTFDFVRALNDRAELLRYRASGQLAVLDLGSAKRPVIRNVGALSNAIPESELGDHGFLAIEENAPVTAAAQRNFRVVDLSATEEPVLLATVTQVQQRATNAETGTTFLLGNDGLTVIRQPRVEEEHRVQEMVLEHN